LGNLKDWLKKNIKTAIAITDRLIKAHLKNSSGLKNLVKDWTSDPKGLGISIAEVHEDVAKCLSVIKILLEEKSNCKHPKKMRDKCGNQWYCMNCNEDIDAPKIKKELPLKIS
jgi:hypothetical protein